MENLMAIGMFLLGLAVFAALIGFTHVCDKL